MHVELGNCHRGAAAACAHVRAAPATASAWPVQARQGYSPALQVLRAATRPHPPQAVQALAQVPWSQTRAALAPPASPAARQ